MTAIRPGMPLTPPPQGTDLSSARSAQAAFFRAALNQTQSAPAPLPSAAVMSVVRTATPARPVDIPPASPQREEPRIMRPGTYLDIRV